MAWVLIVRRIFSPSHFAVQIAPQAVRAEMAQRDAQ
jgi:hypothetical protein